MTIRRKLGVFAACALAAVTSCVAATSEEEGAPRPEAAMQPLRAVPGFVLQASHAISAPARATVERRDDGSAIAQDGRVRHVTHANGWVTSFATDWLALDAPKFPGLLADHNQAVRELFTRVGVPADQTGPTGGTPLIASDSLEVPAPDGSEAVEYVVGYTSTVNRVVREIKVVDSFAAAGLDADGEPGMYAVYWPQLPAGVVEQAIALRDRLADPRARSEFEAKLGVDMSKREDPGAVVIRHSHAADRRPFEAFAVYQVTGLGSEAELLFDARGQRVLLPAERPDAVPPPTAGEPWQEQPSCELTGDFRLPVDEQASIHVTDAGQWEYARKEARLAGRLERTAEGMRISDDEQSATTACNAGVTGRYKVGFRDGCRSLRFDLIEDACESRAKTLDKLVLKRGVRPPPLQLGVDGAGAVRP